MEPSVTVALALAATRGEKDWREAGRATGQLFGAILTLVVLFLLVVYLVRKQRRERREADESAEDRPYRRRRGARAGRDRPER